MFGTRKHKNTTHKTGGQKSTAMRLNTNIFPLYVLVGLVYAQEVDKCPKNEYACLDVINSSLCLSQNAPQGSGEAMAKCVEYDNSASNLTGAVKVCFMTHFFETVGC